MNLLVAFFYPFKGVRGGIHIFNFKETTRHKMKALTYIINTIPGIVGAIFRILTVHFQMR
jgi:hypothetical protein